MSVLMYVLQCSQATLLQLFNVSMKPQFHADQTVYLTHITLQRYCCLHRQPYDDQGMFEPNENFRGILLILSKSYANPGESQPKQN